MNALLLKNEPINVLSLFDGISCGQVALERAGIKVRTYQASEIDKYVMKVTKKNYPNTQHIGSVTDLYPAENTWIDLLLGGSPCQGFSFAGRQLNFDDPRSKLFFEYARILKTLKKYNPDIKFLLENVKMKKEYQDVISDSLGVKPIEINSALVSAQNRKRLYWTNISSNIRQPEDKEIFLKDILLTPAMPLTRKRSDLARAMRSKVMKETGQDFTPYSEQLFALKQPGNKSGTLTQVEKDNLLLSDKAISYMDGVRFDNRTGWDFKNHSDVRNKKSACVVANFYKGVPYNVLKDLDCIRKFHPIECERLQTLPDNYTEGISDTRRYKSIGNGWTVDVIAHILNS
jgi:DNA-cytosine methyltransferase